jgi:hypothetical protein
MVFVKYAVKLGLLGILVATAGSSVLFTLLSSTNYPGGAAFARLHVELATADGAANTGDGTGVSVVAGAHRIHIAVPPAQTGVSLFGEAGVRCAFSTEIYTRGCH